MKHIFYTVHPDDESIGPGPLIHHLTSLGEEVHLIVMCLSPFKSLRSNKNVSIEERLDKLSKSASILGVKENNIRIYNRDISLSLIDEYDITGYIDRTTREISPDYIYFPWESYHHDHRIVHNCCLASTRIGVHNTSVLGYYCYEYPFSQLPHNSMGSEYVKLNKEDIDATVKSCKVYHDLLDTNSIFSPDGVKAMFSMRGYEISVEFAIKLNLVKAIRGRG